MCIFWSLKLTFSHCINVVKSLVTVFVPFRPISLEIVTQRANKIYLGERLDSEFYQKHVGNDYSSSWHKKERGQNLPNSVIFANGNVDSMPVFSFRNTLKFPRKKRDFSAAN